MAALSLILALSALWTGPIWGQDRSWAGSIDPVRISALQGLQAGSVLSRSTLYLVPVPGPETVYRSRQV